MTDLKVLNKTMEESINILEGKKNNEARNMLGRKTEVALDKKVNKGEYVDPAQVEMPGASIKSNEGRGMLGGPKEELKKKDQGPEHISTIMVKSLEQTKKEWEEKLKTIEGEEKKQLEMNIKNLEVMIKGIQKK